MSAPSPKALIALLTEASDTVQRHQAAFMLSFATQAKPHWNIPENSPISAHERLDLNFLGERVRDALAAFVGIERARNAGLFLQLRVAASQRVRLFLLDNNYEKTCDERHAGLVLSRLASLPDTLLPLSLPGADSWSAIVTMSDRKAKISFTASSLDDAYETALRKALALLCLHKDLPPGTQAKNVSIVSLTPAIHVSRHSAAHCRLTAALAGTA